MKHLHCQHCDLVDVVDPAVTCPRCGERDWETLGKEPVLCLSLPPLVIMSGDTLLILERFLLLEPAESWRWN